MSKPLRELGPLGLFFLVNAWQGILWATAAFMVAMAAAIALVWLGERRVPPLMVFTFVAVVVFGTLTIALQDETFIKLKATILNALLGLGLLGGLATGHAPLRVLLGEALAMDDRGWDALTLRYAIFFLALAALNEVVWRNVSTDTWVTFKVFGLLGLTMLFSVAQVPLLRRHAVASEP